MNTNRGGCCGAALLHIGKRFPFFDLLALRLRPVFEAKANQVRKPVDSVPQISAKQKVETRQELAKLAGVSDVRSLYIRYQVENA